MRTIVYVGPYDAVDVPAFGLTSVTANEPVQVSDDIADRLLASADWVTSREARRTDQLVEPPAEPAPDATAPGTSETKDVQP